MATTIWEVARRARVSIASVSRVMNGSAPVTDQTRERVLKAVRQLDYTPHEIARSLVRRQTHTIGLLLPDNHGDGFSALTRGVVRSVRSSGLHLLVSSFQGDLLGAKNAIRAIARRTDGLVLVASSFNPLQLSPTLFAALPVVLLNSAAPMGTGSVVNFDQFDGAQQAVHHLMERGCRRIAHLAGPRHNFDARERLRGYLVALGRDEPDPELLYMGDFTEESGHRAGLVIGRHTNRPDGVFAGNDLMAAGLMVGLTQQGIAVPAQMRLVAFDDIGISRYLAPTLTSIRAPLEELGARAVHRLLERLSSPKTGPTSDKIPVKLVVRNSSL